MKNAVNRYFGQQGFSLVVFFVHLSRMFKITGQALGWIASSPFNKNRKIRWRLTIAQIVRIGVDSVPIVGVITFSTGLIIAMQAAYQLEQFGALIYVADLVGVTMCRELGPLITAIVVTGRSGSAIAAELGTMKVGEEIDALQTMALNPIGFLIVPRLLAMMIVVPCLTVLADLLGIAGGFVLAVTNLKLAFIAYYNQTAAALFAKDFITGLIKSFFFAIIIAQVGVYQGLTVRGGAEGVGKSTTTSVVTSIFLIIFADLIFTMLFFSTI